MALQATVETTAVFYKRVVRGKTKYVRAPFNIVVRDYGTVGTETRGRKSYLEFAYGREPGKALQWDDADGETYDAIEYWDDVPGRDAFPQIGLIP
jgi:hypothetical protein